MATTPKRPVPVTRDPFRRGVEAGIEDGKRMMGKDLLNWLYQKYMAPEIERGTPKAEAILELAQELAAEIRGRL